MKINAAKCKIMAQSDDQIAINNDAVENVEHFVFLGSVVSHTSDGVNKRIALRPLLSADRREISGVGGI